MVWIWVVWGLHQVAKRKRHSGLGRWGHLDKSLAKALIECLWPGQTPVVATCAIYHQAAQEASTQAPRWHTYRKQGPSLAPRHPLRS